MGQTDKKQQILNWFQNERTKDNLEITSAKNKFLKEIKGLKKEELFKKEEVIEKISLWQRIRILIWGN
jgi:hypothetical protein